MRQASPAEQDLARMAGLGWSGLAATTAQKIGSTAGSATMSVGEAILPANPIIGGIVSGAGAVASLVSGIVGPDPRNVPDTQTIEAAQIALNNLWFQISGEQFPVNCVPGRCGAMHQAIFGVSKYPSVPAGPAGNLAIDIDQAMAEANGIIAQAKAAMLKPGSLQNPFFAPGGGSNIPGLLLEMKAARQLMSSIGSATSAGASSGAGTVSGAISSAVSSLFGSSPAPSMVTPSGAIVSAGPTAAAAGATSTSPLIWVALAGLAVLVLMR